MTPVQLKQRMDALEKANLIRSHRKRVKFDLSCGRTTFATVAADPLCKTMEVFDVVVSMPKVGRVKAM